MEKYLARIDSTWQGNLDDIRRTSERAGREINRNREGKSVCLKWELTSVAKLNQGQKYQMLASAPGPEG